MFTKVLSFMAVATLLFSACSKDEDASGPVISWATNPTFETVEIVDGGNMPGKATIVVSVPEGINGFDIVIKSQTLEPLLELVGLTSNLNLLDDATATKLVSLKLLKLADLPLLGKTELEFNLEPFLPMIVTTQNAGTIEGKLTHAFILTVADSKGKSENANVRFSYTKVVAPTK